MPDTTVHQAGAWNLKVGRNPERVAREVLALLLEHDLDWLTVCEAHGYIGALRRLLRLHGYVVLTNTTDGSAMDSAIIVRKSLRKRRPGTLHRLGGVEWERKPGRPGLHWPRSANSAVVDDVLARVMATHLPPGPFGPRFPLRRLAFRTAVSRLERVGRRWNKRRKAGKPLPWVMAGDWNMHKNSPGTDDAPTPAWLAERLRATITGDGIDYVMHRHCKVSRYRRVQHGRSDHLPVLFTVTY